MFWDFNLNTVLLVGIVFFQMYMVYLYRDTRRIVRDQDKIVRENLGVQTNYSAIVSEYVKGYHNLTAGVVMDAKNTLVTLAGDVKHEVAAGVSNAADVIAAAKTEAAHPHEEKHTLPVIAADVREVKDTVKEILPLVNGGMGIQLRLNAELSRWKAAQTGLPGDAEAADKAEKMLRDHETSESNSHHGSGSRK